MALNQIKEIINDIKQGNIAPIYFLMGEEPYYIDGIANYIEENILSPEEKEFNQMILYGRDVSIDDIINNAKRFPMMAERQVVIIKEAQELHRTIENLVAYVKQPQPTTVLVFCYKYKKLDGRKGLLKELRKTSAVVFESAKLYENQVPEWIIQVMKGKGYPITTKAAQMLTEFLGNDLSKINNELEKLRLIIKPGAEITPEIIEENIGISKDFNNFELQNAIATKDIKKAFGIIQYFANNPKSHPLVMTLALLYNFFSKLLIYHSLSDKSSAPKALGLSPYFVKEYHIAAHNYPMKKVSSLIAVIRAIDLQGKGVGAANLPQGDLLKELLVKILD